MLSLHTSTLFLRALLMNNLTICLLFFCLIAKAFFVSSDEIKNQPSYPISASPQLPLEVYAEEFAEILGTKPQLVHLADGFGFTEGPVYVAMKDSPEGYGYFLFTDQLNQNILIMRWYGIEPYNQITPLSWSKPVIFRHPSNIADGQTVDLEGRLLTAETTGRRVSITDLNGEVKTLVGFYEGKPLNSPNDVVVKSDGTVWFTDPSYGCLQFPQECYLPNNVYRFDPQTKQLTVVISNLKMPNGLAFSPDEKILYVIDSAAIQAPRTYYEKYPHAIYAFDVTEDGKQVINQRLFTAVSPGFPDGMRLDTAGNIYVGALDGVQVFNPKGKLACQKKQQI
jgi:gluconolactonase